MGLQNISKLVAPSFLNESALTKALGEEFVLSDNGNIVFHWADFFETCDMIKNRLESDPLLIQDFKNCEIALSQLHSIPVWVKTEKKIFQSNMFDLYHQYIVNHTKLLGSLDPYCPFEISFISGTGPFKSMSIVECFNKTIYRDFILMYLIQGKLPRRDYRIRLKSKILLEYGSEYSNVELVSLEQLTLTGMLFSIDSEIFTKKVTSSQNVRILINYKMLSDGKEKNLDELKLHLSQFAFNLLYSSSKEDGITCKVNEFSVQSAFDFARNKKVFLFISYEKLSASHPFAIKTIKDFVGHSKLLVCDHYLNDPKRKTA
jgi:hypothetical protein